MTFIIQAWRFLSVRLSDSQKSETETNSSPLKVGGWETILSFWDGLFSGSMLVSGETHGNALHEYTYFIHLAYSIYCRSDRLYVIEYMQHIHDVLVHDTQPCAVSVLECRSYMGQHRENSGTNW